MKRKFLVAAFAALSLAACSGKIGEEESAVSDEKVSLSIDLKGDLITKNGVSGPEGIIDSMQVFVFDDAGRLEAYVFETIRNNLTVEVLKGMKDIYVLTNAPTVSEVYNFEQFSKLLSDINDNVHSNTGDTNYVMEGHKSVDLLASAEKVTIELNRILAKVSLLSITNALEGAYANLDIDPVKIYLVNVAGDRKYVYDGKEGPVKWLHKRGYSETEDTNGLNKVSLHYEYEIKPGNTMTNIYPLYCYPNSTETDTSEDYTSDAVFTPRYTRLVFEANVAGAVCYYSINLPDIKSNHHYQISLTITRPGSSHPDIPSEFEAVKPLIEVMPWTDVIINESI